MKNILFATTALVATAGIASADVSISGFAEMGIFDNGNGDMQFFNDIDVTFGMSGETDGGLTFGASVDLDESTVADTAAGGSTNAAMGNNSRGGIAAFVSGGFGTVTLGDTDGASDWAMTETAIGGAMADDHTAHAGYNGNGVEGGDGQVLRYDYSMDSLGFAVSMTQGDDGVGVVDDTVEVGVRYSMDMGGSSVALGLGFMDAGTQTVAGVTGDTSGYGLSASVTSGAITGTVNYSDGDFIGVETTHTGLGIGYTMDALTVGFNWGEYDVAGVTADGYGLAVNYDLGGGAVVQFGYGDGTDLLGAEQDTMSLGLALSF